MDRRRGAMTLVAVWLCTAALLAQGPRAAAQDSDLQRVVDGLYPADRLTPADAAERHSCYQVLGTGTTNEPPVLIAAYTDQSSGVVRVLRRNAAGVFEAAYDSPRSWLLSGRRCGIRLHDVDVDGQPEAFVSFYGVRASSGWIFAWNGSSLTNLTPTRFEGGRESSSLLDPVVYDLTHSGPLRVVASRGVDRFLPGQRLTHPAWVYRPGPSGFVAESSMLAVMGFRADVDPAGNVRPFRLMRDSSPPYTLRVINGDRFGGHRVTGASIRINELEVIGSDEVHAGVEFASTVVAELLTENRVTATLTGPPDATLIVLVEDSTRRQPE